MKFSKKLKQIRKANNLTQEKLATDLNVTRQAISNWENDKNYPDIQILIEISKKYKITLDELINEEEIQNKLISDSLELKYNKRNFVNVAIGIVLMLIGVFGLFFNSLTVSYIDDAGILHENFFIIPISFMFIFLSFISFIVLVIRNIKRKSKLYFNFGLSIISFMLCKLMLLIYANSNTNTIILAIIFIIISLIFLIKSLKK